MALCFPVTDENLASIVAGLNVKSDDFILAIAGSGDQPLALVEGAGRVVAVDYNPSQVEYVKQLMQFLRDGDYETFLKSHTEWLSEDSRGILEDPSFPTNYLTPERLRRIRAKLDCLEVKEGNILDAISTEEGFNKVYMSSALHRYPPEKISTTLHTISEKLPVEGLVYLSDGKDTAEHLSPTTRLVVDEHLTNLAQEKERYFPAVLRKV